MECKQSQNWRMGRACVTEKTRSERRGNGACAVRIIVRYCTGYEVRMRYGSK